MVGDLKSFPSEAPSHYEGKVRPDLKAGDLLLCSGKYPGSWLIRKATGSDWSHVALIMPLPNIDRVVVMESVESRGVRVVPLSKYLADHNNKGKPYDGGIVVARHSEFENAASNEGIRKLSQAAVDRLGYDYDNDEIMKIAARIVGNKIDISSNEGFMRRADDDREFICSEYVDECYRTVGISISNDGRPWVSPADFAADPHVELIAVLQER